jgi:hypothetical protein
MANAKSKKPVPDVPPRKPYKDMTAGEKRVYLLQVVVCIFTLGFVFPNVFD